ncbi:MAG: AAA family ATPase [Candidatus Binatia bacterium]
MKYDPARILVIGPSGVGKTTFARRLAVILAVPHVEVDALRRQADNKIEDLPERAAQSVGRSQWVLDGNRRNVLALAWPRATTVILLNYPVHTIFWRRLKRTLCWVRRRKGRSLRLVLERLGWVARIADRGRQWRDRVHRMQMRYPHLAAFEFQSPGVAAAFLQSLSAAASPGLDADVDGPASSG